MHDFTVETLYITTVYICSPIDSETCENENWKMWIKYTILLLPTRPCSDSPSLLLALPLLPQQLFSPFYARRLSASSESNMPMGKNVYCTYVYWVRQQSTSNTKSKSDGKFCIWLCFGVWCLSMLLANAKT